MRFIYLTFLLFSNTEAFARDKLTFDLEAGRGYSSELVGYSWFRPSEKEAVFQVNSFDFAVGANQSKSENATTGETTVSRGREFSAGIGLDSDGPWRFDFSLQSSSTPETKYSQIGADIKVIYEASVWNFGFGAGGAKIRQPISVTVLGTNVSRDAELDQRNFRCTMGVAAADFLKLKVDFRLYSYSRSKEELQAAYASRFLNYTTSDFVSNIGGLPESTIAFNGILILGDEWDLDIYFQTRRLIVDDSLAKKNQLILTHYLERWSTGVGLSHSETSQVTDNTVLLSLGLEI